MNDHNTKKIFLDHVYVKEIYEKNKKIVLNEIINKEKTKLKLNLLSGKDIDEFTKNLESIKNKPYVDEIKKQIESIQKVIDEQKNSDKIPYSLGMKFLDAVCSEELDDIRNDILLSILNRTIVQKIKDLFPRLIKEERKKLLFSKIFSVFVSLKGLNENISTSDLNKFAESTQDKELQTFLFMNNDDISNTLKGDIPYSICKKIVDLLFDQNVGDKIYDILFNKEIAGITDLLHNPAIKPNNLIFDQDGITLTKQSVYNKKSSTKITTEGIIVDFVVDPCSTIFVLEQINNNSQIRIQKINDAVLQEKTEPIKITTNVPLPKKIEINNSYIFVLSKDNRLTVFDKINHCKVDLSGKNVLQSNEINDFTVDRDGNLLLLTLKKVDFDKPAKVHVFRINSDLSNIFQIYNEDKIEKSERKLSGNRIYSGKKNSNIYILSDSGTLAVYDQNMNYLWQFNIGKTIGKTTLDFTIFDANNFVFIQGSGDEVEIMTNFFGDSQPLITRDSFPPRLIHQNKNSDLYLITPKEEQSSNSEMTGDFSVDRYEIITPFVSYGEFVVGPIDSGVLKTKWHKIQVNVERQDITKTSFGVSIFSSENEKSLQDTDKLNYPFKELSLNPEDSLLESVGRFAWLKIWLASSNGIYSPAFKNLKIHFPRDSYLRYLPKIYQETDYSKELERFLSLFEKFIDDIDEKIFSFHKMLDPQATAPNFLPWLTTWLALNYDQRWPEKNLRNFLNHAHFLYKLRGTSRGLRHMIMFYLDSNYDPIRTSNHLLDKNADSSGTYETNQEKIIVMENFQFKIINEKQVDYHELYGKDAYSFIVLTDSSNVDNEKLSVIRALIESEKPAHTVGEFCLLNHMFILNGHTYLEINTRLTEPKLVLEQSALGRSLLA